MSKSTLIRVPVKFADFLKERAKRKDTRITQEASKMLSHYQRLRADFKKLEGKRVFVIK